MDTSTESNWRGGSFPDVQREHIPQISSPLRNTKLATSYADVINVKQHITIESGSEIKGDLPILLANYRRRTTSLRLDILWTPRLHEMIVVLTA